MPKTNDSSPKNGNEEQTTDKIECFVIMPITDRSPYQEGHFRIVYDHVIKPACEIAGFIPRRSDEINKTNFIVKDILKRLLDSPMAICDLSGQNPNVLFELGIRQAFNKPVTIIKDLCTQRIFDIDGLRCIDYDENLRVDNISLSITTLAKTLTNTYKSEENKENSLIEALSISPAKIPQERTLSGDTSILLESIEGIKYQLDTILRPNVKSIRGNTYYKDECKNCPERDSCSLITERDSSNNECKPFLSSEAYEQIIRAKEDKLTQSRVLKANMIAKAQADLNNNQLDYPT